MLVVEFFISLVLVSFVYLSQLSLEGLKGSLISVLFS